MNNTIFIILAIYVGLDIILGLWLYIHIRCKGWRKWDIAVNFRNLLRMHNRAFKETIAEQVGYADYNETYHEGFENGYDSGVLYGYDKAKAEAKMTEQIKTDCARQRAINSIVSILSIFGL